MQSWFARHSMGAFDDEEHRKLFEADRVAIHYPGKDGAEVKSLDPTAYDRRSASVVRRFAELAQEGGYIWAQYPTLGQVKIGTVEAGSRVEFLDSTWNHPRWGEGSQGRPAIIKSLRMTAVREVPPGALMSLRAARPRRGTLSRWRKVGKRLEQVIEGKDLPLQWKSLSPDQLEMAVSEFLRGGGLSDVPPLAFLLMPPGRTMKDVDIYGVAEDGRKMFVQVTHRKRRDPDPKLRALAPLASPDSHVILFCNTDDLTKNQGIWIAPNQLLYDWLHDRRPLSEGFLDYF
jgi:hypothetical protein